MFTQRISKWLASFRKYLFYYRDGYYELPYISNSPAIMVASFQKMPFTKYDAAKHQVLTHNPFTDGIMRYRELEPGFWLIATEIEFKKNVCTKALYDKEPTDYYFLSHFRYTSKMNNIAVNDVGIPTEGWSLYKPGTEITSYFNAGDKGIFLNFAFDIGWFKSHINMEHLSNEHAIKQYLSSVETYIVWKDIVTSAGKAVQEIMEALGNEKQDSLNQFSLKINCLNLVMQFFASIGKLHLPTNSNAIKEVDRRHIAKAEKILMNSLNSQFPGIETIGKAVHMSPTKLKVLFKEVYGKTLFQYYQEKQMELALELLKQPSSSVKQVALSLNYENASNFIVAFKKYHQFLPSDIADHI